MFFWILCLIMNPIYAEYTDIHKTSSNIFFESFVDQTEKTFLQKITDAIYHSNMEDFFDLKKLDSAYVDDGNIFNIVDGGQSSLCPINYKDHEIEGIFYEKKEILVNDDFYSKTQNIYIIGSEENGYFVIREYDFSYYERYEFYYTQEKPDFDDEYDSEENFKKDLTNLCKSLSDDRFITSPFLFVRNEKTGKFYLLDVQSRLSFNWTFYRLEKGKLFQTKVTLQKEKSEELIKNLKHLKNFVHVLDDLLGHPDPRTEGTLQITARTRLSAEIVVQNVLLRPWVVLKIEDVSQKATTQIDFLKKYAKKKKNIKKLADNFFDILPNAKVDLKKYYTEHLCIEPEKINAFTDENINNLISSYLRF